MNAAEFTSNAPGRLIPVPGGPQDASVAFVPDPLPPKWQWPNHLWPLLLEARTRLASLDGTGKHLPNPEIILHPLQGREAQLSSRLEGTITDPEQQLLFQADPTYPTSPSDPRNAFREVFNYRRALRLRLDGMSSLPLSLRLIRELHEVLMEGVRGADQRPGEFRLIQNQIGRPARFVPPPPLHLAEALDSLEKYFHTADSAFDPLVRAFLTHYQFETIHPFRDGNGRVGRLLLSLAVSEWCNLSGQWLYMSPYFERNKDAYMDLLLRVSTHGDWEPWIRFCLEGVVEQAIDTSKRCDRLLSLHRDLQGRLKDGSIRLSKFIDYLFTTPVITVARYKALFGVTYPTARADLLRLARLGVVQELPGRPEITYFCDPIYRITYEDIEM